MKADCRLCGKSFNANSTVWARHKVSGREAEGRGPDGWYGGGEEGGDVWEEYEAMVGSPGFFGLCDRCIDARMERDARYGSSAAPEWFDPSYAGERWDDGY